LQNSQLIKKLQLTKISFTSSLKIGRGKTRTSVCHPERRHNAYQAADDM